MRFQFEGGSTNDRIDLDQISIQVWSGGSGWTNVAMSLVSNGLYSAQIPAQAAGTTVSYYITATDTGGLSATNPAAGANGAWSFVVTNAVPPPYYDLMLGRPTDTSIAVSVLASNDLQVYFEYGTQSGAYPNQTPTTLVTNSAPTPITINGLLKDQQYYYRMRYSTDGGASFSAGVEHQFHTQRAPGSTFTFDIEADPHYNDVPGTVPPIWQQTLTNVLADLPDFLIDLGDTFMGEKYASANSGYSMTQPGILEACAAVRSQFFSIPGHSVPLFLVNGNHDPELGWWLSSSSPNSNPPVWAATARETYYPCPIPGGFYSGATNTDYYQQRPRDGYYAFEWGDALFVVYDPFWYSCQATNKSNAPWSWTLGTNQYYWLKSTLENSTAKFKFVFGHHLVGGDFDGQARGGVEFAPYFEWGGQNMDGTWGFTTNRPGWPMPIQDLLLSNNVTAWFHGHDHLFCKQDLYASGISNGTPDIIYQEVPQPSHYPYDQYSYATGTNVNYNYQSGVFYGSSGHLRVTVSPTNALVEYVRSNPSSDLGPGVTNRMVSFSYTMTPRATAPVAGFTAVPVSGGAPLTVTFTDVSTGGIPTRWTWDFGDGDASTFQNPTNTYANPGSYTVRLIASNTVGWSTNSLTLNVYSPYDWWRLGYFGATNTSTGAPDGDADGTGMSNTNKFLTGFNPTNAAAYLHIIRVAASNSNVVLTYLGASGDTNYVPGVQLRTNVLDFTTGSSGNFSNGGWQDTGRTNILGVGISAAGGEGTGLGTVTNMMDFGGVTNGPSRYYRVRVLLP
ncbi:MAG TPA: PKD domain-containing protein [Verrucomicrobiae bacterium]|nr:PKD domain-containing protein [Verrucomicrobiae bacterium]